MTTGRSDAGAADRSTPDESMPDRSMPIDSMDAAAPETTVSDGSTKADTGAPEAAVDGAGPTNPPFDWIGIIGTGQSLAVGVGSQYMTMTQPFKNLRLIDNGPAPKYPITPNTGAPQWAVTPLTEPFRARDGGDGQYPNNIFGETTHSAMANTLSATWAARGGLGDYITVHEEVGWSGHALVDLNKSGGKLAYPASLSSTAVWKALAAKANKTYAVGGIIVTHGESDSSNASYGAGIYQLWQDYNTDLKAITGQKQDLVLLISQQSSIASGAKGSAVQVWQAGVAHPGQVICTGPKYQIQHAIDNTHLPAPGYVALGQKYAEVFDRIVNLGEPWKPLQPKKISRAGAIITIDFDVTNPPLVWDTHISPPHQQMNTAWAGGKGFEVKNAGGTPLTITNAVIQGLSVVLTLAADPGAGKVTVAYAVTQDGSGSQGGTNVGLRGLLRDSDEFVGYDAETLEAQATQGMAAITSTKAGGFLRRALRDIVTGNGVPADIIVAVRDLNDNDKLTLSAPWPGATGKVMLSFRHDERNYCVHFSMTEP